MAKQTEQKFKDNSNAVQINKLDDVSKHVSDRNRNKIDGKDAFEEKHYTERLQNQSDKTKEKRRFNPLLKKYIAEEFAEIEHYPIRKQAKVCRRIALLTFKRFKNRGRGDTAVNGILFASRQLISITKELLKKPVTPKSIYEFRSAKAAFEKAKKMSVSDTAYLPYVYRIADFRRIRKQEEEEDSINMPDFKDNEET